MSRKKRQEIRTFHRIVYHSPTYTVTSRWPDDNVPLTRGGSPPTFKKKTDLQSAKSMKRLSNCINWMLIFSDKKRVYSKKEKKSFSFRLAFITLTLSAAQVHTDKHIKDHMLQPFLYWCSRYYSSNYVWKAETQLNGNIHFHITIDTFIHWKSIRAKWNQLLAAHNYCKVYQDGTNDRGNASTQIKCVINEIEIAKYLGSYMAKKNCYRPDHYTKTVSHPNHHRCNAFSQPVISFLRSEDNLKYLRFISGRLWGCSENLSKVKLTMEEYADEDFFQEENYFFRTNKNTFRNLGKLLREREEKKLGRDLNTIEMVKFQHLENVWLHRNLITMKKGPGLSERIYNEKHNRQKTTQKHFTVGTLK